MYSHCKNRKEFKQDFYNHSNKIKSEGYYLNGKPNDTLKRFLENGKINSIEIFNDKGVLNGESHYFFKSGHLSEIVNFNNGIESGKYISYRENGNLEKILFMFNGKRIGDAYFYDERGILNFYNFSDFGNQGLLLCKYDTTGKLIKEDGDFYFVDSMSIQKGLKETDTAKIFLLISHRPQTSLSLWVDNISKDGKIIDTRELNSKKELLFFNDLLPQNTDSIRIRGSRFDSLSKVTKTFIIMHNIN